jgi:SM-20-related protein
MMARARATAVQAEPPAQFAHPLFDFHAFEAMPLAHEPFDFLIVPGFIHADALDALNRDFPAIDGPGNVSPDGLRYGPAFAALLGKLRSGDFATRVGARFGTDLSNAAPTMTVRRHCEATDGDIHTDHRSKLLTVLLYFNKEWPHESGRLRILRSATDMEDYAAEVVPAGGAMLAFRRTESSFHGHKPFVGERRILQLSFTRGGELARKVSGLTKPIRRLLNVS